MTTVTMRPPAGQGQRPMPKHVATPLQRQVEEEMKNPTPPAETASQWGARYPESQRLLSAWARQHPRAAEQLARWEAEQPDHVRVLVLWAVTNRFDTIDAFMIDRAGWDDLMAFRQRDPQALEDILEWCRQSPRAASELVLHSPGFGPATKARGVPRTTVAGAAPMP